MKEIGPVELMGSQLGLPEEEESIERRKCSHRPHRGAVYHLEPVFVSFASGKGIYLLSSVPWVGSLLQPGHTVMHACTYTRKHNDVCRLFLPTYIILSTLYRLSGVLDLWKAEERRKKRERANGKLRTAGGQFTALCWEKDSHVHTMQFSSAVLSPELHLQHPGLHPLHINITWTFLDLFNLVMKSL